jgi:hypothetical protein
MEVTPATLSLPVTRVERRLVLRCSSHCPKSFGVRAEDARASFVRRTGHLGIGTR